MSHRPPRSRRNTLVGTVAHYGPTDVLATKLVASVVERDGRREPVDLHRWITHAGDIRADEEVSSAVAEFFRRHGVKEVVTTERLIGCPHEEGKDYPLGRTCPHCPFWANRDRFTHELLPAPVATLTPEQTLAELSRERDSPPFAALVSADAHRTVLVDPLLAAIDRGIGDPAGLPTGEGYLFSYAVYLLAKWREPRAYAAIVRWLSLPGDGAFAVGGDIVTQDGSRLLAAVCDGDLDPIKALIVDRQANEYCRAQAIEALALLAAWAEIPREPVIEHFVWLAHTGLERTPSHTWAGLACTSLDCEALPAFEEIRRALTEGLIEPGIIDPNELDDVENAPRGEHLERWLDRHPPIKDVAEATSWWSCFRKDEDRFARAKQLAEMTRELATDGGKDVLRGVSAVRSPSKVGRNDPCPCGSGKKYKKCCGRNE